MADYKPQAPYWYISALGRLVSVVRELSQAHGIDAITAIVRDAARALTGADGATFVLRDGAQCYDAEENAIAPLWKGKRFPIETCVSIVALRSGRIRRETAPGRGAAFIFTLPATERSELDSTSERKN
jgi:hypothetical protein